VRQRLPAGSPLVVLGLAVAGVAAYVLTYALDTTSFLNDEYGTVTGGRVIARDLAELWTATGGVFNRGPERLTSLALAVPDWLAGSTPDEMRGGHVLLAVAYALVALPAYALMRGLDVPRWPAAGLAVVAILGPWMVFGATLLNVTLAAPLTVLFAWLTWRAVVRPTVVAELLAVGAAVLMTTARASHATFFAAAVLAAVATAWWTRRGSSSPFPVHLARRSPVIVAVTVLGALALVVFGSSSLAGRDYADAARLDFPLDKVWEALSWTTAVVTVAGGFLPLIVGGAWALRQLVRPADVRAGAFAVIAVAIFLAFVYLMGASEAQEQERYAAPLLALPVVALGAALFRRGEAWLAGSVVVGLLSAWAIEAQDVGASEDALAHFFSPALLFSANDLAGVLGSLVAVGVAAAVIVIERWRPVAVGLLVALGVVGGVQTLQRYEPATAPGDLDGLAWVDDAVGDADALFWNYHWPATAAERDVRTRQALYFNGSLCCAEAPPGLGDRLDASGRIERGDDPDPQFLVGHSGYRPYAFAAKQASRPEVGGLKMRVDRFAGEPLVAAEVEGAAEDGAVDGAATIRAQPGLAEGCLDVELYNREDAPGPVAFRVRGVETELQPDQAEWVRLDGTGVVSRTAGEVPVFLGEIRFVGCRDPMSVVP
jgi:hypothetical protein